MSFLSPAEIDEFIEAQDELRAEAGSPCTFRVPQDATWPGGTKINDDTGRPYSATVVRTNPEFDEIVITALVILKQGSPLRPQADTHWDEVGLMSGMDIILDVADQDWATVSGASEFEIVGVNYELMEHKPFALGGKRYRVLVYGQEK